ncbi:MAG: hypothetical protein U0M13_03220, partial [Desulfovibrio fairfieldensis]|nr:hypothetical protein [Desulfovibrio fairfieldensis]
MSWACGKLRLRARQKSRQNASSLLPSTEVQTSRISRLPRTSRAATVLPQGQGPGKNAFQGLVQAGAEIEDGGIQGKSGGHGRSGFRATG